MATRTQSFASSSASPSGRAAADRRTTSSTPASIARRRRGRPSTSSKAAASSASVAPSVSLLPSPLRSQSNGRARSSAPAFKNGPTIPRRNGVSRVSDRSSTVVASSSADVDLVVVGAGASGLAAALSAHRRGHSVLVLESSDAVGGRVATDVHETEGGTFLLDRGFQIFLTSYPTVRSLLDFDRLRLKPFYAGAAVRFGGSWNAVADPFRHPLDALATLLPGHPIGSPLDKVRVGILRATLLAKTPRDSDSPSLLSSTRPETTTLEALRSQGFGEEMVERFFRPFLGGIFFDDGLGTSSRLFEFVMRSLATGSNCLPDDGRGIGGVAWQMAESLPEGSIKLGARVVGVEARGAGTAASAVLDDGTRVRGRLGVVVATERDAAEELLGETPLLTVAPSKQGPPVGTTCLYFDAPVAPLAGAPMLMLNGELREAKKRWKGATVNNATCLSSVAPSYAPRGRHLVSVSTVGIAGDFDEGSLVEAVREQLDRWCGKGSLSSPSSSSSSTSPLSAGNAVDVSSWKHLKTYRIPYAQPPQSPPTDFSREVSLGRGLFVAGDHRGAATLEGAMAVGVRAADEAARRGGE